MKQISSGSAKNNKFGGFLQAYMVVVSLKLEKVGPIFSTFNPCSLFLSIATGDRKQVKFLTL